MKGCCDTEPNNSDRALRVRYSLTETCQMKSAMALFTWLVGSSCRVNDVNAKTSLLATADKIDKIDVQTKERMEMRIYQFDGGGHIRNSPYELNRREVLT